MGAWTREVLKKLIISRTRILNLYLATDLRQNLIATSGNLTLTPTPSPRRHYQSWINSCCLSSSSCSPSSSTLPLPSSSLLSAAISESESDDSVHQKVRILQDEGFTTAQIRTLSDGPYNHHFLAVSPTRLSSLLRLLKKHGVSGPVSGRLLAQSPSVLRLSLNNVEAKIEFFVHQIGTKRDPRLLVKLITHCDRNSSLISMSLQNIKSHVHFLTEELGMDAAGVRKMVINFPSFFALNLERNLQAKVQWLLARGLDKKDICWLWRTYPTLLHLSVDHGLTERLELVEKFGLDLSSKAGLKALGFWSSRSPKSLMARFEGLKAHGFSHEDAVKIVQKHPGLICCTEETISKKVRYLVHVLQLDMNELVKFPAFLNYSLEKRIMPRFNTLSDLKSKGLLKKDLTLSSALSLSNDDFCKRFQAKTS